MFPSPGDRVYWRNRKVGPGTPAVVAWLVPNPTIICMDGSRRVLVVDVADLFPRSITTDDEQKIYAALGRKK